MHLTDLSLYHPLLIHFPIVLFFFALFTSLFSFFIKPNATFHEVNLRQFLYLLTHLLVILATLFMVPSLITGLDAAKAYPENNTTLEIHKYSAIFTLGLSIVHSAIRVWALKETKSGLSHRFHNALFLLLVVNTFAIFVVADYGGLVARGITPFQGNANKEKVIYYSDPESMRKKSPVTVEAYLNKQVSVNDVLPIFAHHGCINCHADKFVKGYPVNFSSAQSDPVWLPRNQKNELVDWPNTPFYQVVILNNAMPLDSDHHSIGLPIHDRLILLNWLKNGAP